MAEVKDVVSTKTDSTKSIVKSKRRNKPGK